MTIVVTGASGQLGRAIVQSLARLVPPAAIVASMRDPTKAGVAEWAAACGGVTVRRGDYTDAASLKQAFAGATLVLLVSSNARATGGDSLAQHQTAIAAAVAAGAQRVLYTSHAAASPASAFFPMRDHAATEAMLAACGLPWTALRNGFYASSGVQFLRDAIATGVLAVPADGPTAWVAHADLAEAAAAILAQNYENGNGDGGAASYDGPTPPLTGPQALDFTALCAVLAQILGRPVRRDTVTDEAFLQRLGSTNSGLPEHVQRLMLSYYEASRHGEFAAVDPALERLIKRPPTTMATVMERHVQDSISSSSKNESTQ